jgi:hypothetical protein
MTEYTGKYRWVPLASGRGIRVGVTREVSNTTKLILFLLDLSLVPQSQTQTTHNA